MSERMNSITRVEASASPERRLEPCPGCGIAVLVRKDERFAIHSRGKANVGESEINLRCTGSEKHFDSEKRAAEAKRLADLREELRKCQ